MGSLPSGTEGGMDTSVSGRADLSALQQAHSGNGGHEGTGATCVVFTASHRVSECEGRQSSHQQWEPFEPSGRFFSAATRPNAALQINQIPTKDPRCLGEDSIPEAGRRIFGPRCFRSDIPSFPATSAETAEQALARALAR